MTTEVSTYGEFSSGRSLKARLRGGLRDLVVSAMGLGSRDDGGGWVRFPYYHHVYDDERRGFEAQLDWMAGHGEFIGLDDAVALLGSGAPVDGRYWCVTFDDGLAGCRNAIALLAARGIPAAFYLTSGFMGQVLPPGDGVAARSFGFHGTGSGLGFLSWDECRSAVDAGMTMGSHTTRHVALAGLDQAEAMAELAASKQAIEIELGRPCLHFCAPFGMPGRHYLPERDPTLAAQAGYASFATGLRGPNRSGEDPLALRRDHLLAGWHPLQLRWFLSRP